MRLIARDLSTPTTGQRHKATKFNVYEGFGSPEGVQTGNMGDLFVNRNGGSSTTLYVKETGFATNTGWSAAGSGGASGWIDEEIFTSTEGQTEFTITQFTLTADMLIEVLINGVDQDEGGGFDWVRNVAMNKIVINTALGSNARVKVKQWS